MRRLFAALLYFLTLGAASYAQTIIGYNTLPTSTAMGAGVNFTSLATSLFALPSSSLSIAAPWTVNVWVKGTANQASNIFAACGNGCNRGMFIFDNFTGTPHFITSSVRPGGNTGTCAVVACIRESAVMDGNLHMLTLVYDAGGVTRAYLDSGLIADNVPGISYTPQYTTSPAYWQMGAAGASYTLYDLRLYSRVLVPSDLNTLYTLGQRGLVPSAGPLSTGMATWNPLNGCTSCTDSTGNGNTFQLDSTPPTVAITSPSAGTVSSTITLTATCSDTIACSSVAFLVDGTTVATVTTSPFTTTYSTLNLADATHSLTAVGTNVGGITTTSAAVSITTSNGVAQQSLYYDTTGSDSNACTIGSPCQTISGLNGKTLRGGDVVHFQGGQTFTGCVVLTGGTNTFGLLNDKIQFVSYGSGHAVITPNCTASNSRTGAVQINNADGILWNGVDVQGDASGNASSCFYIKNAVSSAHSGLTIENSTTTQCHNASSNVFFGAHVFFDNSNNTGGYSHISILNMTMHGTSATSGDSDNGIGGFSGSGWTFDNVQGNLVYYMSGQQSGVNGSEGNGITILAASGGTVSDNISHDNGGLVRTCGGPVAIWAFSSSNIIFSNNESYNQQPAGAVSTSGLCDEDGFDADGSVTNTTFEYNYSHNNWQQGYLGFASGTWGPITIRYNISWDDGIGGGGDGIHLSNPGNGTGTTAIYNNTIIRSSTWTGTGFMMAISGTCGTGAAFVNNILASYPSGQNDMVKWGQNGQSACASGYFENNDLYAPNASALYGEVRDVNGYHAYTGFSNLITGLGVPTTTAGNVNVTPTFSGGTPGTAPTCNSTSGPQPCPSGLTLGGGSALKNVGLDLTQAPFSYSVGSQDYYGSTIPTGTGTGYPIGASN